MNDSRNISASQLVFFGRYEHFNERIVERINLTHSAVKTLKGSVKALYIEGTNSNFGL